MTKINNNDNSGRRVVYTRDNTTLEEWKKLLLAESKIKNVDMSVVKPLAIQHAWEIGDTPISFAAILKLMQDRRERTAARLLRSKSE